MRTKLHLIANAHIDPVWLWDWREGLNEGLSTCRSIVDLLHEFPEATFIRGEAAIYEHVRRHDPVTFAKIVRLIRAGRWDVVGGNYVQPDNNLPATEPLLRQFVRGKEFFRRELGVDVTAAWATDSFGHSAGLPDILAAAGIDSFACSRPSDGIRKIAKPAFWWRGCGGARVLAFRPTVGWYGCERDEIGRRLDAALGEAVSAGLTNGACFYGLGNHGGGPSRRHLLEIREWTARHPEVEVVHSGLHRLFAGLRTELRRKGDAFIPTVEGELNFCLRGCSASVARFKYAYRRTQAQLLGAERTAALASAVAGHRPQPLKSAWDSLLFNAFHDILPGSSIERAYDDQYAHLGGAFHDAQDAGYRALLDIARTIDTRAHHWTVGEDRPGPVPVLIWNPHPRAVRTQVEIEAGLDSRPLWPWAGRKDEVPVCIADSSGRLLPHQTIPEEHDSLGDLPWRKRVVLTIDVPAFGWNLVHLGLAAAPTRTPTGAPLIRRRSAPCVATGAHAISNGLVEVTAGMGKETVGFQRRGRPWIAGADGAGGLQVRLYEDHWGSWGGMNEEPDSWLLTKERERWCITDAHVLENGPERSVLWVRFAGARSQLDLTVLLARGEDHVVVRARVFFNDRSARLKLVLPTGGEAEYEVPGGAVRRQPCGEVPGGRWVRAGLDGRGRARLGFASDALYGFDTTADEFRATVVRATRYAGDAMRSPGDRPWMPTVDCGELRFQFLLTDGRAGLPELADLLEEPLVVMPVPSREGERPGCGGLGVVMPSGFRLLALRGVTRDVLELRLQNEGPDRAAVSFPWFGRSLRLGRVAGGVIATWRLQAKGGRWQAVRVDAIGGASE